MTREATSRLFAPARAWADGRRLWGMTPQQLHDRYWAVRRVQVVRPGSKAARQGPAMYLLVGAGELVFFDLKPVTKRFNRLKPRVMRLRVHDRSSQPYTEVVESDGDDRFLAIRRRYAPRIHSVSRVWLTPDRTLARAWAAGTDRRDALRRARAVLARDRRISLNMDGRVFDRDDPAEAAEAIRYLLRRWTAPDAIIGDVYEHAPGVWLHEHTRIPKGVRVVGPLWIGAGIEFGPDDVLVGPGAFGDAPDRHPPVGEIDWQTLSLPTYRLLPQIGQTRLSRVVKRSFDIAFSMAVLAASAPLYPLIATAIWMEDGWPPFFAHTRQTVHNRSFPCYKFRTMYRNAEQIKAQLVAGNVCDGPQFYIENDPRVLKIGKFLRKFHLDELPQFLNVLLGHMSVVGPRPSPDRENQYCPAWREARLSVRPGITGLWQVRRTRAPETDFQEWIRYDLEYVKHASWKLDLWIIFQTVKKMVGG